MDFKTLITAHPMTIPKVGDVVKCKIISIDKGDVHVDIEGLTVGVVRGRELFAEANEYASLKVGNEVEATVLEMENENGEMELSFRIAGYQRAWDNVRKWMQDNMTIKAKVLAANKGGLMVQLEGLAGFVPVSQLNPEHYPRVTGGDKNRILEKLRELINQEMEVKVIDVNEKEEKLIVSEKAVWEDSQKAVLESYKVGDVVEGEISALTSFGAFVKFGQDLEGLVHISEIAWQRIDHPKDILKVGDKIKAQIIQLDRSKIYLSIKRMVDDPWKLVKDKYKVGDKVGGKILKIEPFGLMVALDKDIHGLAHISELADEAAGNIADKFKIGQVADFEIVSLEPPEHRLGLRLYGVKGKTKKTADSATASTAKEEKKSEPAKEVADEEKKDVASSAEVSAAKEEVKKTKKTVKKEKKEKA